MPQLRLGRLLTHDRLENPPKANGLPPRQVRPQAVSSGFGAFVGKPVLREPEQTAKHRGDDRQESSPEHLRFLTLRAVPLESLGVLRRRAAVGMRGEDAVQHMQRLSFLSPRSGRRLYPPIPCARPRRRTPAPAFGETSLTELFLPETTVNPTAGRLRMDAASRAVYITVCSRLTPRLPPSWPT